MPVSSIFHCEFLTTTFAHKSSQTCVILHYMLHSTLLFFSAEHTISTKGTKIPSQSTSTSTIRKFNINFISLDMNTGCLQYVLIGKDKPMQRQSSDLKRSIFNIIFKSFVASLKQTIFYFLGMRKFVVQ